MPKLADDSSAAPASENDSHNRCHGTLLDLMTHEGPGLLRMLHRMLGNQSDALDAYQECFCKLAGRADHQTIEHLKAYLYRTASNIAIECIRARKRQQTHLPVIADMHDRNGRAQESQRLRFVDESAAAAGGLQEAIAQLPSHLRQVVVLRDLCRLSYADVGRSLGIEPGTARVYRRHAIVRLGKLMGADTKEGSE